MPRRKATLFSDQLRQAVKRSGFSQYRICQETGIDAGAMCSFLKRRRGLSMDSVDRLVDFLGLAVVRQGSKKGS